VVGVNSLLRHCLAAYALHCSRALGGQEGEGREGREGVERDGKGKGGSGSRRKDRERGGRGRLGYLSRPPRLPSYATAAGLAVKLLVVRDTCVRL